MKTTHLIYSLIILILTATLMHGCAWIKGYGKVRLVSKYGDDMSIQKLEENWDDYHVSYAGSSPSIPAAIMFDPKNDGRKLVGDRWTRVEDGKTVSEIIGWIKTYTQFFPSLHVILGPDNQLYGYVFYPRFADNIIGKLIDDRTIYVYDLESPVYINGPSDDWQDR
jgi:hypothetical protein